MVSLFCILDCVLALDCGLEFNPAREEEFFAALPPRPAVVLIEPRHAGAQPYLLRTADLRRRLERLLRPAEGHSKRLNLREFAARVRFRLTGSPFEQSLVHYQHARGLFPERYRALTRLRPPALLKVNLSNEYPRCYVTRRIRVDPVTGCFADRGFYFGPFASRKSAGAFANEFLNLFKIRRCQIKIRRDPAFPGDEDVPGALLCGLHEGRVRRRSRTGGAIFSLERRVARP